VVQHDLLGVVEVGLDSTSKYQLEVMLLALVSDVDNTIGLLFVNTVAECCHVRGVVVEATIGLLDHQRHLLLGHEDTNGTIAVDSYA